MRVLLNSFMWGFGVVLILALFLALTQQIEQWLDEEKERDDRSRS